MNLKNIIYFVLAFACTASLTAFSTVLACGISQGTLQAGPAAFSLACAVLSFVAAMVSSDDL